MVDFRAGKTKKRATARPASCILHAARLTGLGICFAVLWLAGLQMLLLGCAYMLGNRLMGLQTCSWRRFRFASSRALGWDGLGVCREPEDVRVARASGV